MEITLVLVLFIIFLATFVRATLGFGDALVAMPLLVLILNLKIASPLVAFGSVIIATSMLINNWKMIEFKSAWRLILASLLGIPIGLVLLKFAPETLVKYFLGLVLILFGLYNLVKPDLPTYQSNFFAYISGFVGGVLGGAYNCNGPPVIIYGKLAKWSPQKFRATLQCYFVPTAYMIMINHGLSGMWTPEVLHYFVFAVPVIIIALIAGTRVSRKIKPGVFDKYVYAALILMGILMFL